MKSKVDAPHRRTILIGPRGGTRQASITTRLPTTLLAAIARVIVQYAHLEYLINESIYLLSGVEPPLGRVVIKEPRITDRLDMLNELLEMRAIDLSMIDNNLRISKIRKSLEEVQTRRHRIAHGVWLRTTGDNKILLRSISGKHTPFGRKVSRRMMPEAVDETVQTCKPLLETINNLRVTFEVILSSLPRMMKPLPDK
jgi:hypothetical protein